MKQKPQVAAVIRPQAKIKDGLGVCRSCINFDTTNFNKTVQVGDFNYFSAVCKHSKNYCFSTRVSLLTCIFFKSSMQLKSTSFIIKFLAWLKEI